MSIKDKEKWNKKYLENKNLFSFRPPSLFIKNYFDFSPNKEALDIACGGGRNTIFLQNQGFYVDAIDISEIALKELSKSIDKNRVNLIEADLDEFEISKSYGLIVMANFLDRDLINKLKNNLVDNGIFIVETYVESKLNEKPFNKEFMLKKDELKNIFNNFEIIEYSEFMNESFEVYRMKKAAIVAKRV